MLTAKQHELLMFIDRRLKDGGISPSFDEMREALRARDERLQMMLAGIAHEVRNPLNTIRFNLLNVQDLVAPPTPAGPAAGEVGPILRDIAEEVDRLEGIVRDFLRFGYSARGIQLVDATGYVSLNAAEVAAQLAKIPPQ